MRSELKQEEHKSKNERVEVNAANLDNDGDIRSGETSLENSQAELAWSVCDNGQWFQQRNDRLAIDR